MTSFPLGFHCFPEATVPACSGCCLPFQRYLSPGQRSVSPASYMGHFLLATWPLHLIFPLLRIYFSSLYLKEVLGLPDLTIYFCSNSSLFFVVNLKKQNKLVLFFWLDQDFFLCLVSLNVCKPSLPHLESYLLHIIVSSRRAERVSNASLTIFT